MALPLQPPGGGGGGGEGGLGVGDGDGGLGAGDGAGAGGEGLGGPWRTALSRAATSTVAPTHHSHIPIPTPQCAIHAKSGLAPCVQLGSCRIHAGRFSPHMPKTLQAGGRKASAGSLQNWLICAQVAATLSTIMLR